MPKLKNRNLSPKMKMEPLLPWKRVVGSVATPWHLMYVFWLNGRVIS